MTGNPKSWIFLSTCIAVTLMLQGKLEKLAILGTVLLPSWECSVFHLLFFLLLLFVNMSV